MPVFTYRARQADAQPIEGRLEADSRIAALDQLSSRGLFPIAVDGEMPVRAAFWKSFSRSVSQRELSQSTRQLADLLAAGMPLLRAILLASEQTAHPVLSRAFRDIGENVRGGQSLSDAFKREPGIFSPIYISLIYAGEVGGSLSLTLNRLADFVEAEAEFRSRVQAALAYPLFIAGVGSLSVLFLILFAVPRLGAMFDDMGQSLPLPTRLLLSISSLLSDYGFVLILLLMIGCILIWRSAWKKRLSERLAAGVYRIPVWGPVLQKSAMARFSRTLETLLSGGVPIVSALEVAAEVLSPSALSRQVRGVAQQVSHGQSLSESLRPIEGFPAYLLHMLRVGEEVNALHQSLGKVATVYERETERAMKLATALLEPCMILVMGIVVGGIVMAMLLPIFEISTFVK